MISPFERMQELAGAGVPFAVATVVRTQGLSLIHISEPTRPY